MIAYYFKVVTVPNRYNGISLFEHFVSHEAYAYFGAFFPHFYSVSSTQVSLQ